MITKLESCYHVIMLQVGIMLSCYHVIMSSTVIQTVIHRHPRGGGGDMTFTDFTDVTDYFTDFY